MPKFLFGKVLYDEKGRTFYICWREFYVCSNLIVDARRIHFVIAIFKFSCLLVVVVVSCNLVVEVLDLHLV